MRKRVIYGFGVVLLAILVALVVWQGSFDFGDFGPSSAEQTFTLWAVSTLIFILTVTLGFMLTRNFIKLYVERHSNREGSRIRTKLVLGALALTFTPVVFLVIFSVNVVNRNLDKWFSRPAEDIKLNLIAVGNAIDAESRDKAAAIADWISSLPEAARARQGDESVANSFQRLCIERHVAEVRIERQGGFINLCKIDTEGKRILE